MPQNLCQAPHLFSFKEACCLTEARSEERLVYRSSAGFAHRTSAERTRGSVGIDCFQMLAVHRRLQPQSLFRRRLNRSAMPDSQKRRWWLMPCLLCRGRYHRSIIRSDLTAFIRWSCHVPQNLCELKCCVLSSIGSATRMGAYRDLIAEGVSTEGWLPLSRNS